MKTGPVKCDTCQKKHELPKSIRDFWRKNPEVPYICAKCLALRVHDAVIASDVAKFIASTHAMNSANLMLKT